MRTTFGIFAAAASAALGILTSCQQQGLVPFSDSKELVPVTLTASFVQTKVSYEETSAKNLKPSWEEDDKVIGFDGNNNTYEFTVSDVNATSGAATLTGTAPANCTLHLIYLCGAAKGDITSGSLSVSYDEQAGDNTIPAVMLADGKVTFGTGDFHFSNAGAVIGISAVNGVPSGSTISKITVEGENLSAATVSLDGSTLKLAATPKTGDAISTATLSGITTTDANGTLSSPIFIAVPAGADIAKVSASVTRVSETVKIPSTAAEKEGVDYVTIAGKKWAKWNIGANSQSDYGWYFAWGGTEGYVRYANTWQLQDATSFEFSYTLSSAKTANASDYLYVETQSFTTTGHLFDWAHAPFNNGSPDYDETYFISVSNTVCPGDILALDYDAARVNWGGTWRMPTSEEFYALYYATYWAWDSTDKGFYVFKADATHTAGTRADSVPGDLNKADALLFFPAAGYCSNARLCEAGNMGNYWSSSLFLSDDFYFAYYLFFYGDDVDPEEYCTVRPKDNGSRYYGIPVRPLSD